MPHAYLFSVSFHVDGVCVESFLDITMVNGINETTTAAAKRLGIVVPHEMEACLRNVNGLHFRARCIGAHVHKITTEEPIDIEALGIILNEKHRTGAIKTFLLRSRV
jgi:hypothetical protein